MLVFMVRSEALRLARQLLRAARAVGMAVIGKLCHRGCATVMRRPFAVETRRRFPLAGMRSEAQIPPMATAAIDLAPRFSSGAYLQANEGWHEEDSAYKVGRVLDAISDLHPRTIVDVGCGAGSVAELIADNLPDCDVTGFDPSPDAATLWRGRRNVEFRCADFIRSDQSFDLALCLDVIEHVEDVYGFLRQLRQRAGTFVFNIPLDMCVAKLLGSGLQRARSSVGHIHYFDRFSALAVLRECGYQIDSDKLITPLFSTRPRNRHQWKAAAPRFAAAALGAPLAAKLVGGYSLLVVARS